MSNREIVLDLRVYTFYSKNEIYLCKSKKKKKTLCKTNDKYHIAELLSKRISRTARRMERLRPFSTDEFRVRGGGGTHQSPVTGLFIPETSS